MAKIKSEDEVIYRVMDELTRNGPGRATDLFRNLINDPYTAANFGRAAVGNPLGASALGLDTGWADSTYSVPYGKNALAEAMQKIQELTATLEGIKKEPLILYEIDRLSSDKKHAYVKKGENDIRIEAPPKLNQGDEVLLHPKTFQIVEVLGKPPLETSRFAPDSIPSVTWDDIGGLEEAKVDFIEAIELPHKNKEVFKAYNKKNIKGILLSGPPGCGKTMLGKASANSLATIHKKKGARTGFLYVKGPEILDPFVGASEKIIRDIFSDAKRHKQEHGYPAVVFIDEADAILAARGSRNIGIGNTIVPMFLTEMDGLEESDAIVIIATNRADILDPAIVRDGRIDRKIIVTRPREDDAYAILHKELKKTLVHKDCKTAIAAKEIIELMYSVDCKISKDLYLRDIINGAMLVNCVHIASSYAMKRDIAKGSQSGVMFEDLKAAVNRIQVQSCGIQHELEKYL